MIYEVKMKTMKVMTKKRLPNFEILRVLAMYFIVIWHFIGHGMFQDEAPTYNFNIGGFIDYSIMQIIMIITAMAVNLYVLITGYFMIESKPRWNKIPHIYFQVLVYSILIMGYEIVIENIHLDLDYLVHNIFIVRYDAYWFVTKYIALVFLAPFINVGINNINKKNYRLLLIIMLFMDVNLFKFFYGVNYSGGQSLFHFIFLYIIAGYIRIWRPFDKMNSTKIGLVLLFSIIAVFTMETSMELLKGLYRHEKLNFHLTLGLIGNNEFTVFTSVLFFLWISKLRFNLENSLVNVCMKIAPMTFAVYLISDNNSVRPVLWKWIMSISTLDSRILYVEIFVYSFAIFIACIIMDYFVKKFISYIHIDNLLDLITIKIKQKLNVYLEK